MFALNDDTEQDIDTLQSFLQGDGRSGAAAADLTMVTMGGSSSPTVYGMTSFTPLAAAGPRMTKLMLQACSDSQLVV